MYFSSPFIIIIIINLSIKTVQLSGFLKPTSKVRLQILLIYLELL